MKAVIDAATGQVTYENWTQTELDAMAQEPEEVVDLETQVAELQEALNELLGGDDE